MHRLLVSAYFLQYLDLLFKKDPHAGQEFHALQVPLFAEFDRPRLLPFLRSSNYYPLQKALDVCQERSLIPEMVFLLGESGIVITFKMNFSFTKNIIVKYTYLATLTYLP